MSSSHSPNAGAGTDGKPHSHFFPLRTAHRGALRAVLPCQRELLHEDSEPYSATVLRFQAVEVHAGSQASRVKCDRVFPTFLNLINQSYDGSTETVKDREA